MLSSSLGFCHLALANPINWGAYLPIQLSTSPTYNNTLQGSGTLSFTSFSFANNSLLFTDMFMGAGTPVLSLNVSNSNANLTWNQLSSVGMNDLTVNGSGLIVVKLVGYGQAPDSVSLVGNVSVPWNYDSVTDTLSVSPTGDAEIIWDYPTLSMSLVLGVAAVALLIAMTALALAVFRWRKNSD